ncbi:hypothetical protein SD81_028520 [Tolypothrix campylonemoides VB511288]|nr:hypothetical protein SD81_028520 [Tolypothrix campylonemoides VB511288]
MKTTKAPKFPDPGAPRTIINAIVLRSVTSNQLSVKISSLTHLIQQHRLTDCLELLEKRGIEGDTANFWLGYIQQIGGEG